MTPEIRAIIAEGCALLTKTTGAPSGAEPGADAAFATFARTRIAPLLDALERAVDAAHLPDLWWAWYADEPGEGSTYVAAHDESTALKMGFAQLGDLETPLDEQDAIAVKKFDPHEMVATIIALQERQDESAAAREEELRQAFERVLDAIDEHETVDDLEGSLRRILDRVDTSDEALKLVEDLAGLRAALADAEKERDARGEFLNRVQAATGEGGWLDAVEAVEASMSQKAAGGRFAAPSFAGATPGRPGGETGGSDEMRDGDGHGRGERER